MALVKLGRHEIRAFLLRANPAMLGVVGTNGPDGFPHIVPVWYYYDGARVHVWTLVSRTWVKNVARDNRVAFSVQEEKVSSTGVTIRGRAIITTGQDVLVDEYYTRKDQRLDGFRGIAEPRVPLGPQLLLLRALSRSAGTRRRCGHARLPAPQAELNVCPSWNREYRSGEMSIRGVRSAIRSASDSPIGGPSLKPWPLPPRKW